MPGGADDTELRADTAEELEGMLALDHQQRPVASIPARYPVAPPLPPVGRPVAN